MESGSKKRVSHVGQSASKKKSGITKDVVADIIQEMDKNILNSKLPQILKQAPREVACQSKLDMPSAITTQSSIAPLQQKKFLTGKRHPLMEKAQKSKNYIKHNRSMPKPRAHLGGLKDLVHSKKDEKSLSSSNCYTNDVESNCYTNDVILSDENASDDISKYSKVQSFTSDSESDFEDFIQAQKPDKNKDKKNCREKSKLKQHGTKRKSLKQKKGIKDKKLKSKELRYDDDKSIKAIEISSKVTATNRLRLPETSDSHISSNDESESSSSSFKMGKLSTEPSSPYYSDVEPCKQIDTKTNDLCLTNECTVRIKRNPLLDETATQLNPPLNDNDCESLYSTELQNSKNISLTERKDETAADSDDDCMIICEVPQSNVKDNIHVSDNDTKSDIQILNVVSLGEHQKVTTNNGNSISIIKRPSSDENTCNVDFEKLKEAFETAQKLNSELNKSNPVFVANATVGSMQTITDRGFEKASIDVKKKDLEKILSLASNVINKLPPDGKMLDSLPYSSSITDADSMLTIVDKEPACPIISTDTIENVTKKDLKKILLLAKESSSDEKIFHSSPCSSSFIDDLSSFKNIPPSKSEIITGVSRENTVQDKDISIKQDCYDPCDELDILGIRSIQDLHCNQSSQNILHLLHLYRRSLQEYNEIKNSEESLTISLKILEESKAAKIKHLKTVLNHLIKNDPCLYSTLKNNQETKHNFEKEEAPSKPIKKCVNCGAMATIFCDKCKKVFFCSRKCGVEFWEVSHYMECEGNL